MQAQLSPRRLLANQLIYESVPSINVTLKLVDVLKQTNNVAEKFLYKLHGWSWELMIW